jgi:hypothetical protein
MVYAWNTELNPIITLPFGGMATIPSRKMVMTWGWFMALGLPHYGFIRISLGYV